MGHFSHGIHEFSYSQRPQNQMLMNIKGALYLAEQFILMIFIIKIVSTCTLVCQYHVKGAILGPRDNMVVVND